MKRDNFIAGLLMGIVIPVLWFLEVSLGAFLLAAIVLTLVFFIWNMHEYRNFERGWAEGYCLSIILGSIVFIAWSLL